jgi:hypothetical protein
MARKKVEQKATREPVEIELPDDDKESRVDLADAARSYIIELAKQNSGHITAEQVVAAARDENSPLHDYFDWDDTTAAEKYRLMQGRTLIRTVRYEFHVDKKTYELPYFVRDPDAAAKTQGMVATYVIQSDEDKAREVIVREFKMAASAIRRARGYAAVLNLEYVMDDFIDKLDTWRSQVGDEARAN